MLDNKLNKIQEDVTEIKETMAKLEVLTATNTTQLEEHVRRSLSAEKRLNILEGFAYALTVCGATILGLHSLGILDKLFGK